MPQKLHGMLNDPLWLDTKPITNFRQREPFENKSPTEETEVRILYTASPGDPELRNRE
jgi:hypothetical protein